MSMAVVKLVLSGTDAANNGQRICTHPGPLQVRCGARQCLLRPGRLLTLAV